MPQFDKITFFNQLFWLLLFFSGFYLVLLHYFLPRLGSVLKARQKMLKFFLDGVSTMLNERNNIETGLYNDCSVLLGQKNLSTFLGSVSHFVEWVKSHLFLTFNTSFKKGITAAETRLYRQTSIFLITLDLKVSEEFFSDL